MKAGDRVGWGYCHGSCATCTDCLRGQELYCNHRQIYGSHNTDQGSFASAAVWDEAFLYEIPPTLSSVAAAPLMCAGAAVYSALHHAQVRPATRVGVLGVGGLGHLAIRFAAKMGCDVVVLSHTAGKQAEAAAYGASEFHVLGDELALDRPIDCLLVTASQQPEWARVLPLVRRGGTVSLMTVDPEAELRVPYMDVLMNALRIEGSLPAPRHLHREMLRFAALHGIEPVTEVFPLERGGIERAFERLEKGEMRYRGVLVQAS
ncbi:NADP-dependent alcohol dehydrogenase C 1 [Lasiodiplodia hormozganensis]|uniref:NADP-dependent alcohol dehydrogenase C 1 n=1 Tax=Lasiodiplodia hormozganensis TaxID=869390 RepID=A0AA40C759_9PEZI|nr:NADP-dependent alcohol dehydrogenase C 1 [Lasiodiplodia hormozganensis]